LPNELIINTKTRFFGADIIIFVNLFGMHALRTKSKSCQTDLEQNEQAIFFNSGSR